MSLFRKEWTPAAAENWSIEDWTAIILSVIAYLTLTVGTALAILLIPAGFLILAIGLAAMVVMYRVIDPKLKMISTEYEKKQADYLRQLEEIQKWEKTK